jgi:hypothetical protein
MAINGIIRLKKSKQRAKAGQNMVKRRNSYNSGRFSKSRGIIFKMKKTNFQKIFSRITEKMECRPRRETGPLHQPVSRELTFFRGIHKYSTDIDFAPMEMQRGRNFKSQQAKD